MKNILSVVLAVFSGFVCSATAQEKPNLIVILTDDQGYADVGFNGSKDIRTPNIDRLAQSGARFTNGYVTYAVCGPSRAGLLTGRYQDRFGFGRNPVIDPNDATSGLPLDESMISEVLEPVGYTSGIVGKWHMGTHPKFRPNKRGFDYFYGFLSGGHRYFPEELTVEDIYQAVDNWSWYKTKLLENETKVELDKYLTDKLSDKAIEFVEREKDNPFFLYLAYNAPHTPLQATQEYLDRNKHIKNKERRTYAAMVTSVDDGVGRLLNKLEELDISENTIVFFLSDNGGAGNNASDNGPLRGHKGKYTEGGIRVPFAVSWPGTIPSGVDYDNPVSSMDIMATIAEISKAPVSDKKPLDGVNLIPFLTGNKQGQPHDALYWRNFDKKVFASREGNIKTISSPKSGMQMYNLSNDLAEQHNISQSKMMKYLEQDKKVENWNEGLIAPIFKPLQKSKNKKN
ncbi:N-acetylgalactosamine 6-sulfate sulfatase [Thalassotalea euphylliae]|uniref:N-acetylgalactosamine 6-sulfate sulfatase n=1 Tax=Thalassotalea euphylliae TaxID=1655234 RepID=A0A3E0TUL6_9GAMM|nr:sulfatase-like hydrolase/transferase [Thalassotalea euphylliae]REL28268.1 N-acetylgalactosamine 6-sulfate sulfatase [Thalassotalea euphylliae]